MVQLKFCTGVVWYNPDEKAIKRIKMLGKIFETVYVYDNSVNNNYDMIRQFNNIVYLHNGKNDGISIAFNKIAKLANGFDFLFALDQDTEIRQSQIIKLKKYISDHFNSNIGIYCPDIYFGEKSTSSFSVEDVDFTITSCSMINISIFKKINGYDEKIFLDGVDRDFCFRLRNSGYRIKKIGSIKVRQHLGNDKKSILGVYEHSAFRNYYIAYNRRYFISKFPNYFKNWNKMKCLYLSEWKQLLNISLFEKNKISKVKNVLRAIKDYKRIH